MTSHIRHGIGSVRPYLHGPLEILDFLKNVFGAAEIERHEFGPESFHVELKIGDSVIAVEAGALPPDVPAWSNSVYVYVEDADAVYEKAIALGAECIAPPADKPYEERQAGFRDMAANVWWIGTYQAGN